MKYEVWGYSRSLRRWVRHIYPTLDFADTRYRYLQKIGRAVKPPQPLGTGEIGNAVTSVVWDPVRAKFYAAVRAHGASIRVVSSGIATIIHDALARAGVVVDVLANDVDFAPGGWTMQFVDPSDNGHDKAAHVRAARARGSRTAYAGDGVSDFEAALAVAAN